MENKSSKLLQIGVNLSCARGARASGCIIIQFIDCSGEPSPVLDRDHWNWPGYIFKRPLAALFCFHLFSAAVVNLCFLLKIENFVGISTFANYYRE